MFFWELCDEAEYHAVCPRTAVGNRFVGESPLEGTGFEPSVPRQEKWSMPSSSDQTRVGRTLTLGGGAESSQEGRDIELSVSPKTSVLRLMISARTARIDDNLGRGTDGSNPLSSSGESDELRIRPPLPNINKASSNRSRRRGYGAAGSGPRP